MSSWAFFGSYVAQNMAAFRNIWLQRAPEKVSLTSLWPGNAEGDPIDFTIFYPILMNSDGLSPADNGPLFWLKNALENIRENMQHFPIG